LAADNFDDSKADEALKFIREHDSISLGGYRVVGNCVRHDSAARDLLIKIKDQIISCLRSNSAWQENYLIGGLAGSGKTFFVEELGAFIERENFATFKKLKLSDDDKPTFLQKLAHLKEIQGPLLCLVDEVDKTLPDPWPFIALLTPLEKSEKPYRSHPTCFVLVGSGGKRVSELKNLISSFPAGDDFLRRVSFKREEDVLPTSPADRIVMALSVFTVEARKSGSVIRHVDKLALLYIALKRELASPSKIANLAERCIRMKKTRTNTVWYNDLFDSADRELGQFQNKWDHTGLLGSLVYVEDDQPLISEPKGIEFDVVFERVETAFGREMQDNFLRDLDYSGQPDYIKLLSPDFRRLFKSFFKGNDKILVVGHEGVGKTFNCLLFGKMLASEGYQVYYSSVRDGLLADSFLRIADLPHGNYVFIIDDCQEDLNKTSGIIESIDISRFKTSGRPKFIFLSHPLDEVDTVAVFGRDIRILEFKERYVDLEYLATLFFQKVNRRSRLTSFLDWLHERDTLKAFSRYKNMRFWNIYFRAVEMFQRIRIDESAFLNFAYQFFRRTKPQLIELKDCLAKLLPFFASGGFVLRKYVEKELQIAEERIRELEQKGIIDPISVPWEDENWNNIVVPAIRGKIHPTEAKILEAVLKKCCGLVINEKVFIDYSAKYLESLYYIIREMQFYDPALLEDLCEDERFKSILQKYLKERHLGKHLDRTVRILSRLPRQMKSEFVNDEVIEKWVEKLNDAKYHMNSKVSLLEAIYKTSPVAAYKCYKKLDISILAGNFKCIPNENGKGLPAFTRFIEVSKNIWSLYLFSINEIYQNELNGCRLSDNLIKDFKTRGYILSDSAKVEQISTSQWRILDQENTFLIGKSGRALNVFFSFDDLDRQAFVISKIKLALHECLGLFLERFETDMRFSQMHWLLKRLDAVKLDPTRKRSLANCLLDKISPYKLVEWIRLKDTAVHELRFVLKTSRFVFIELEGKKKNLYDDFLKCLLNYEDVKRVFDNPRSRLYSICITSKFGHELLANHFYEYSHEASFAKKVSVEKNLRLINESVELVEKNDGLSDHDRHYIIYRIMSNTVNTRDLQSFAMKSMREAKRLGKQFDAGKEMGRFLDNREKYATPPS